MTAKPKILVSLEKNCMTEDQNSGGKSGFLTTVSSINVQACNCEFATITDTRKWKCTVYLFSANLASFGWPFVHNHLLIRFSSTSWS